MDGEVVGDEDLEALVGESERTTDEVYHLEQVHVQCGTPGIPTATVELVQHRVVLYAANALHLNSPKKLWTWVADLYAVSLGLLAITGLFVLKGKTGITGRGAWLTAIGVAVPGIFRPDAGTV